MANKHAVHFSSESVEHETPQPLFDRLNKEFNFQVDVCAQAHNCKVANYFSPEEDGLKQVWRIYRSLWMNPPYARGITGLWVRKAFYTAMGNKSVVVCLLPARTDQPWWFNYVWDNETRQARDGVSIEFCKGRLHFNDADTGAPFPSVIVIFDGR